jgi:hypothetical protein
VNEAKGKVKEEIGKAKRDPDMQDRGTAEKVGEIKKVFGKWLAGSEARRIKRQSLRFASVRFWPRLRRPRSDWRLQARNRS